MPPFQTSEALRPAKGFPGGMVDMSEWNANSGFIEGTTLRPGMPVQRGTVKNRFAPLTAGGQFMGILRHHITHVTKGVYENNTQAAAVDAGHIFGRPGGVCTVGTPVYWNSTLNSGEGGYTSTATGGVRLLGAEFMDTVAATDEVVPINLQKLPGGIPA